MFKTLFILYRELFKITKQIFYLEIVHKCSCEKERQLVLQLKEGEKSASHSWQIWSEKLKINFFCPYRIEVLLTVRSVVMALWLWKSFIKVNNFQNVISLWLYIQCTCIELYLFFCSCIFISHSIHKLQNEFVKNKIYLQQSFGHRVWKFPRSHSFFLVFLRYTCRCWILLWFML